MAVLFISANDIEGIRQVSYKTACKILNDIIKYYGLPKEREISLNAFCKRYDLREEQVLRKLEQLRQNNSKN